MLSSRVICPYFCKNLTSALILVKWSTLNTGKIKLLSDFETLTTSYFENLKFNYSLRTIFILK
jgi:hypothetical protein